MEDTSTDFVYKEGNCLSAKTSQDKLVAGAGFEPTTFGL